MVQGVGGSNPLSHPIIFNDLAVFDNLGIAELRDFCGTFVAHLWQLRQHFEFFMRSLVGENRILLLKLARLNG